MDAGETIEIEGTGQRIVVRVTADASHGESVVFESFLPPSSDGLAAGGEHEQRFEVLRGSLCFSVGGEESVLAAGERLTVPRGTPCRYWNPGAETAHLVAEVRPARGFEAFVRGHR